MDQPTPRLYIEGGCRYHTQAWFSRVDQPTGVFVLPGGLTEGSGISALLGGSAKTDSFKKIIIKLKNAT
tara:strand:- start:633 stop:839 length:207 start_codon:yes stop_codon:yes gene_type:complete